MKQKTVLEEVFALFCYESATHPAMKAPFVVGNKTYATSPYSLVRCDNDKIDFAIENNEAPVDVEKIIPQINTCEKIDIDSVDWESLMSEDEMIEVGKYVACGHCGGDGVCYDDFTYKGKFYEVSYNCPVCNDTGYEEEPVEVKTGKKTFSEIDLVDFKDKNFPAKEFYKLKKVKDLIGGEVTLISTENDFKFLFQIGVVEVLIARTAFPPHRRIVAKF